MWRNERFTSWMCRRQICSNCVMLSYQYGPKSLRNVSNTLLNLCHEELRHFWRQNWVQPGTSHVYLIKWPVSVYKYIINKCSHYNRIKYDLCPRPLPGDWSFGFGPYGGVHGSQAYVEYTRCRHEGPQRLQVGLVGRWSQMLYQLLSTGFMSLSSTHCDMWFSSWSLLTYVLDSTAESAVVFGVGSLDCSLMGFWLDMRCGISLLCTC